MSTRTKLILLVLLLVATAIPARRKKKIKKQEVQEVKQEQTAPAQEPEKKSEPDIFQSAVIVKNDSFSHWKNNTPWLTRDSQNSSGTGFIYNGNKIITNAHVVLGSSSVSVKNFKDRKYYPATVKFIGHDCDLALLEVTDPGFISNNPSVPISSLQPIPGTELILLGFPEGSESLSVERGTVTGFDKMKYAFSGLDYRNVIKVNTDIKHGFSGGPAIAKGELHGIAFQISRQDASSAYLIPAAIIQHFLKDTEDGTYDGFPDPGFEYQSSENKNIKSFFRIPESVSGVLVSEVFPATSFASELKKDDFIFQIDDKNLSDTGLTADGLSIEDLFAARFTGDEMTVHIYRNGLSHPVKARLKKSKILDVYRYNPEDYFLDSGLLFQPLSRSIFANKKNSSSLSYHYEYFFNDSLYQHQRGNIILTKIFHDPENISYENFINRSVESINGKTPTDLQDFKNIWNRLKHETVMIKFRGTNLPLILSPSAREKINIRVKTRFGVGN